MNKIRRKSLQSIMQQLEELRDSLEDLQNEEEECRDNIPDNLLGSERYEKAESACSYLEEAVSNIEDAIGSIELASE